MNYSAINHDFPCFEQIKPVYHMKSVILKTSVLVFLLATLSSCLIPSSSESYLKNFSRFVDDVEKNGEKFSLSDWQYANKRFGKYTGEWYGKFSDELTIDQQSEVSSLKIRYLTERGKNRFARFFKNELGKDLDRIKEDAEHYLKKELPQDMQELSRGAREIGDSAKKVMQDIINQNKKKE
jgi:hypothetical protein